MATICHLGAWGENWGDRAIQYALQKAIGTEHEWRNVNIQERLLFEAWEYGTSDLLLIGGGGLLWDKPELKSRSGWQWDISVAEIQKLEMPLVVHSIGLTKFPYGEDRTGEKPEYWDTLGALVEKAELFSVRNEMTRQHLIEGGLHNRKITVCPDPALFLGEPERGVPDGPPILGVCLAWDKTNWRWPGRYGGAAALTGFMDAVGDALRALVKESNWRLRPICHLPYDGDPTRAVCWMADITYDRVPDAVNVPDLAASYAQCTAVVSMRKHGLLIPAGLGVPVVGLGDLAEVGAICEQLGADCIRSEDATVETITEAILGAKPISETARFSLRQAHCFHIAQIKDLLT